MVLGIFPHFSQIPMLFPTHRCPFRADPHGWRGAPKALCAQRGALWSDTGPTVFPSQWRLLHAFAIMLECFPLCFFGGGCFNTAVWTNTHCITNTTSFLHFNLLSSLYTKLRKWSVGMALYVLRSPPYFTAESLRLLKPVLRGGWIDSLRTQK